MTSSRLLRRAAQLRLFVLSISIKGEEIIESAYHREFGICPQVVWLRAVPF